MRKIPPAVTALPVTRALAGRILRWLAVGAITLVLNLSLLAGLVDLARWPVPAATLAVALIGTVLRFLANDRFVFGHRQPAWSRFTAYCIASSGSVCVGYALINTLVWLGLHYLLAALTTTACSVILNFATNFLWVWRSAKPNQADYPTAPGRTPEETGCRPDHLTRRPERQGRTHGQV